MAAGLIGELEIHVQYCYVSNKSDRVQIKNKLINIYTLYFISC